MSLVVVGASHHTVGMDELAQLAPIAEPLRRGLVDEPAVSGSVVLATCNRFEVYLDAVRFHEAIEATLGLMSQLAGPAAAPVVEALQIQVGEGAVAHCLTVACGLDSMVVGEAEIAGQVRAALAGSDTVSPVLRRLFQHALSTSKAVTTRTRLGAAGRSVASVGLDLVELRHGPLADRRTLLIGTGAYARVVAAELSRRGCTDVWVHSATGRAEAFARTHPVTPVHPGELVDALARSELIITCSGASTPVLDENVLTPARSAATSALPIIDLSLGGDLTPAAAALPGVDCIDLKVIGEHAPTAAATAILAAQEIVARGVATFLHLEGGRAADPAVVAMRSHIMEIIGTELELVARRYPPEIAEAVARSLRRVSNELMHTPSLRAQELARTGELDDYRRAMRTLFGIDIEVP